MKQAMTEQMFAKAVLRIIMDNSSATTIDEAFDKFSFMTVCAEFAMENRATKETEAFEKAVCKDLAKEYMNMNSECWSVTHAIRK